MWLPVLKNVAFVSHSGLRGKGTCVLNGFLLPQNHVKCDSQCRYGTAVSCEFVILSFYCLFLGSLDSITEYILLLLLLCSFVKKSAWVINFLSFLSFKNVFLLPL